MIAPCPVPCSLVVKIPGCADAITGLGAVTPTVPAGAPTPLSPYFQTVNPVTVTIGGQSAQVLFAGLTPQYAGLYQVNAIVPSGVTPGGAVQVVLQVAGQTSPPVTMAVVQ